MYQYGLLRKDASLEAERHNAEWLGPSTLGIEVTSNHLADKCGLGNIDPQHQSNGHSSAIEYALNHPIPPPGSKLVTIRPDKDSLGAMAVLTLRADGKEHSINKLLVSWIGALDRFGHGAALEQASDLAYFFEDSSVTDALNVVCLNSSSRWRTVEDRVKDVMRLISDQMSASEIALIKALYQKVRRFYNPRLYGNGQKIALLLVTGELDIARNWANHRYPVAVIYDDSHLSHGGRIKKWTVIRQSPFFDRRAFEEEINQAEAEARGLTIDTLRSNGLSWGGNLNIVSSPAGVGNESKLPQETVMSIVCKHFESGLLS